MDNWQVVIGGVTISLVALYFAPQISSSLQAASPRKKLHQRHDPKEIHDYLFNHPNMHRVAQLLKQKIHKASLQNVSSSATPSSPSLVSSPISSSLAAAAASCIDGLPPIAPAQNQIDEFISFLTSTFFAPRQNEFPLTAFPSFSTLSPSDLTLFHHQIYLLAMRHDATPDHQLQAFYDVYSPLTDKSFLSAANLSTSSTTSKSENMEYQSTIRQDGEEEEEEESVMTRRGPAARSPAIISPEFVTFATQQSSTRHTTETSSSTTETSTDTSTLTRLVPPAHPSVIFPAVLQTIEHLFAISTFNALLDSLMTWKVDHANPIHSALLQHIWKHAPLPLDSKTNLFPTFSTQNTLWGDIGFQGRDPTTDFRGCGFLGLAALASIAQFAPQHFTQYVLAHQRAPLHMYGLAITVINVAATIATWTHDRLLDFVYLEHGVNFVTFVRMCIVFLELLFEQWQSRARARKSAHANTNSDEKQGGIGQELTVMDFPFVFKDVCDVIRRKLRFHDIKLSQFHHIERVFQASERRSAALPTE